MRRITEMWRTRRSSAGLRWLAAAVFAASALAAACSQAPTSPTPGATSMGTPAVLAAEGTKQSWQDFQARGWHCRTPNNGPATVCSPPEQPLPVVAVPPAQPPADRPDTVLLKRWRNGVFEANVLLMRPEIYNGQPCESTRQAYTYITVLGYFECAHTVGN